MTVAEEVSEPAELVHVTARFVLVVKLFTVTEPVGYATGLPLVVQPVIVPPVAFQLKVELPPELTELGDHELVTVGEGVQLSPASGLVNSLGGLPVTTVFEQLK